MSAYFFQSKPEYHSIEEFQDHPTKEELSQEVEALKERSQRLEDKLQRVCEENLQLNALLKSNQAKFQQLLEAADALRSKKFIYPREI